MISGKLTGVLRRPPDMSVSRERQVRRSRVSRPVGIVGIIATLVCAMFVMVPTPATAGAPGSNVTGSAAPIQATLGSTSPTLTVTGPLAGLVQPLVSGTLGTLWSLLQTLPSSVLNPLVASLIGGSSGASTPPANNGPLTAVNASSPPAFCPNASCYSAANLAVSTGIANLGAGLVQGWVQYDDQPPQARPIVQSVSRVANIGLGLLGLNVLSVGAGGIASTSACTQIGSATTPNVANVTALGGAIGIQTTGGNLSVKLPGDSSYNLLSSVVPASPASRTISALGVTVSLTRTSSGALQVTVPLTLSSLLGAFGLGALSLPVTTTINATLTFGAGATTNTATNFSQSWGLDVGLDLSADVQANVLGTVVDLNLPSGLPGGTSNIADLKFGYASCTYGSTVPGQPTMWTPPELN